MTDHTSTIPIGWRTTTLGDVIQFQRGFDLPTRQRKHGKYPMIVSNGIDGYVNEFKVNGPGVVTGRSGSLGAVFFVKDNFWPLNTTLWVKDFKGNDEKFVYYWLLKFPFEKYNAGTGVPTLNRNHVHEVVVNVPSDRNEQQAIAAVLSALDSKIELLSEQNKTLEQIAQTFFKECFIEQKKPALDKNANDINYSLGRIADVATVLDSKRVPLASDIRASRKGSYPYYGATEVMDYIDNYIFDGVYVLVAEDGSVIDKNGYAVTQYVSGKIWVNNHAHVLQGKNGFTTEMLYLFFSQLKVNNIITGAVQLKINQENLLNIPINIPSPAILECYGKLFSSLFKKVIANKEAIATLTAIKDNLLSKLMSGEIRVKGFESND